MDDILKVAFYLTEHMRSGGKKPAYELFISRKEHTFLTYDYHQNTWRTARLSLMDGIVNCHHPSERWISKADFKSINAYLGVNGDVYESLNAYQNQIRREELKKRHRKETDPWDADLKQTPKLPTDWKRWVSKVGIQDNYIYYHYTKKGAKTGYCTFCDKEVPIRHPKHNAAGRCTRCRHPITFKSVGRAGTVVTERHPMYLLQRCKDGFMCREFYGYRKYAKGQYQTPECVSWEVRRVIYESDSLTPRAYYHGLYRQCETRWIATSPCSSAWGGNQNGPVYGKTLPDLGKKELRKTGLTEWLSICKNADSEKYLAVLRYVPQLEQLVKAGLFRIANECLSNSYYFRESINPDAGSSLSRILCINTQELKRLRQNNGGMAFLRWLQFEKITDKELPDEVISWFCKENIKTDDLKFISSKMSIVQIYNYVRRQMSNSGMQSKEVLTTWSDYLSMAKRLGMNTEDAIIFRVRKLRQRHDELVSRCQSKALAIQAGEILEKYPHVDEICHALKEKYEYADENYTILAPARVEDIIQEGRNLSHCVADSERYWDRIERHEAYVLFLRRSSDVEKPYYTLEIEPDGTVRQKRTQYDRQEDDIEQAKVFLTKWQSVISKRLTDADRELAKTSKVLRNLQFEQLRKDQVIIHTGTLNGSLLVDALMADLMEAAA
ncbi:PcfJ domain-containing protein [Anaerotignum sp.]|uniref:PcfJ domain-containing protein n=1 Tax=Anaerotignum sp. TaxID=2039241 RepID=UPI0028A66AE0|nr:PcfJ domain-containing protein [Anaerotignum sp.]